MILKDMFLTKHSESNDEETWFTVNFATFTSIVVVVGCTSSSGKVFTSFADLTSCENSKKSTHPLLETQVNKSKYKSD